jgi:mono/diheme cytochrome c family protein
MSRSTLAATACVALCLTRGVPAGPPQAGPERVFSETVRPFLDQYCIGCHGGAQPVAQFDLRKYKDVASVVADLGHWSLLLNRVSNATMPPKGVKQPDAAARNAVVAWIAAVRKEEARRNAGDPGIVLARRLSNAEYDYTIRDLTGADIRPAREFPVDPANQAGFDNSGESLSMSPSLLNKHLQAAREVANHLVLHPSGISFAPHPALAETDRDKYCVNRVVDFYHRQNTEYADYFLTAWRYKHRAALGKPRATLADFAAETGVSPKYLATVWRALEETREEIGPLARLQSMWRALPATVDAARPACERMRDWVVALRAKVELRFPDLSAPGISRTAQPFLMWRNRQYASHRRDYDRGALQVEGEAPVVPTPAAAPPREGIDDGSIPTAPPPRRHAPTPDLHVPLGQRAAYEAAFARFAAIFPDAFYVQERGRYFPDTTRDKGRFLSAGFHNLMGYFRDDAALYELLLSDAQQKELDDLWKDLDFVASANIRTYVQFYLFETREAAKGAEGGATPEPEITSQERIRKVQESYLARARAAKNETAVRAVEEHFNWVNDGIRWVERARIEAEPVHLKAIQEFAARAWRRPLTPAESADLLAYYRDIRSKDALSHEDAMRELVVSILMSPDFSYRVNTLAAAPDRAVVAPLSDYSLASRLSYFIWSSMPDQRLLDRAAAGELRDPAILSAEARRMLKDPRARGLAVEFAANWLDVRRFEEHNAVDRARFPSFTGELRQAMFEEPIRFFLDVIGRNRSVLDLLYGRDTFVNAPLAAHYGMTQVRPTANEWAHVENAAEYGRGGLLPMAVFLTKNAPGLRTSPVKRGYWVVRRVLGEEIPPPPAVVPELPRDEAQMDLPLRELLARHRQDASCAGCHTRFDGFGLVFERYGPVGERRANDLAGRAVDTRADLPGGAQTDGLDGLRAYIREHRQNDFIDNLCRRLFAYALGRGLILSDDPAIEEMRGKLAAGQYRFETLIDAIVRSPQFRNGRRPLNAVRGE